MKAFPKKRVSALVLAILGIASTTQASLITTTTNLPPAGVYLSTDIHQIYGGPALEFLLTLPAHYPFANEVKRDHGGQQSDGTHLPGTPADEIETFGSKLTAVLEVKVNGVSQGIQPITASGPFGSVMTLVQGRNLSPTGVGTFNTEMLKLDLSGPGFMIRESPTLASTGKTTVTDIGGGLYKIDSFFDVFTELSIDGGRTWMPGHDADGRPLAGHVTLEAVPEPSTLVSFVLASFVTFATLRRRRSK